MTQHNSRRGAVAALMAGTLALTAAACGNPGNEDSGVDTETSSSPPSDSTRTSPGTSDAPPQSDPTTAPSQPASTDGSESNSLGVTSDDVSLHLRVNTDLLPLWQGIADGYMSEYPNVTVDIIDEEFGSLVQNSPRYVSGEEPADLVRFPALGESVRDGFLFNIDPYVDFYGWDEFPASQLNQWRVGPDGLERGAGSLYALGIGYAIVGMYYNVDKAEALGMTEPPKTVEELESWLAAAKEAGEVPLMAAGDNSYLFQGLAQTYGEAATINDWIWHIPGATVDTQGVVDAAQTLADWRDAGYLPDDIVAVDDNEALARFSQGAGVFFFQGSWNATGLDAALADSVGFFAMPPTESGGPVHATSTGASFVIPAGAEHPNEAAAFLDYANGPDAAQLVLDLGSLIPGGAPDLPPPSVPEESVTEVVLQAYQVIAASDGFVNFMADSTPGMHTNALAPQLQLLYGGRTSPSDMVAAIQQTYVDDLG